jgi:RNA polymerase sigma-54 factor
MNGMRIGMDLSTRMDQKMILAPRMIQSMEILQLTIVDLVAKIDEEMQKNPFLETKEHLGEQDAGLEKEFNPDAPLKHDDSGDLEFNRLEALNKE